MNKHYENLSKPPADAIKKIDAGKLKGMSDINPQWRYEALTKEFGLCGIGWKFEIVNTHTEPIPATQELMIFAQVNLYVKEGDTWSEPIPGFGGDRLIIKDKNGVHGNDEAFKMAITDAIGTAAKMIGVAADVYRGRMDSKYSRKEEEPVQSRTLTIKDYLKTVAEKAKQQHLANDEIREIMRSRYKKEEPSKLTLAEAKDFAENIVDYAVAYIQEQARLMEGV